jgi:pyruvate-formate lyase-activating enzyme
MKHYIDESMKAYDSLQVVVFTGGESFIYGRKLEEILRHAKSYRLMTRIVTNGYWAKSYDIAFRKLGKFIDAGLTEINFSTGDDHLICSY